MEQTYTKHRDYFLPDLDIPAQEKVPVNRYGQMHGDYLKKNNRTAYNELKKGNAPSLCRAWKLCCCWTQARAERVNRGKVCSPKSK